MSEEINTFIPRVTPTTNILTKYIAQTAYDLSYLDGRENLQAIKSVAVGATINPPDFSDDIIDSLVLSDDSINDLTEEEILELIEKRKERQKEEEMLLMERREAREELILELQVKSTGTTENPALTVIAPESKSTSTPDKSSIIAKAYSPAPKVSFEEVDTGFSLKELAKTLAFSGSENDSDVGFKSDSDNALKLDTNA